MTTYTDIILKDTANNYFIPYGLIGRLGDVTITNPTQGQSLTYDATNNVWKNTSSSATVGWGGITGNLSDQTDLNNALSGKQNTLVSGTDIKTINGTSVLGSGNINTPYRNVGEIVECVLPLTDAGLHLLDGALIDGSGIYSAFVDYIADLYDSGSYPDLFETEANWQTSVSTYGVCGKFVYTQGTPTYYAWYVFTTQSTAIAFYTTSLSPSVGDNVYNSNGEAIGTLASGDSGWNVTNGVIRYNTNLASRNSSSDILGSPATVRLPKITGIIEGTTDVTALLDLVQAGLPSISHTHTVWDAYFDMSTSKVFQSGTNRNGYYGASMTGTTRTTSANSTVSSIYGNSSTVQPQTIKVLYYIVIANSTKTDIEIDIDEIATDLNGKADVDLANLNTAGKIAVAHLSMPANEGQKLLTTAYGTYTAPYDGYAYAGATSTSTVSYVTVNCTTTGLISTCWINASGNGIYAWVPCAKGQSFTVSGYNATLSFVAFKRAIGAIGDT